MSRSGYGAGLVGGFARVWRLWRELRKQDQLWHDLMRPLERPSPTPEPDPEPVRPVKVKFPAAAGTLIRPGIAVVVNEYGEAEPADRGNPDLWVHWCNTCESGRTEREISFEKSDGLPTCRHKACGSITVLTEQRAMVIRKS